MADIILKGLFIGFLTSAPMGPIGVLCVQRTLNEGRRHGLMTGLGAALSDILFAIIAGVGIGFVIDFVETNHSAFEVLGSLILIVFSFFISKNNPAKKLHKHEIKLMPVWKDFLSSFFINSSNIGILFLYMALFARFTFFSADQPAYVYVIGILCIGLGAITWWLIISYLVDRFKSRFNLRALAAFNKLLGIVLLSIGIVGLIRGFYYWEL